MLLLLLFFAAVAPAGAQQISLELRKSPLPINQYYTISIKLQNQQLKEYTPFPEIDGFKKSNKYSSTKTIITGGKTTTILTVTQNYAPLNEGVYVLKPFAMKVNGQNVQSQGMQIEVLPVSANAPPNLNQPDLISEEANEPVTEDDQEFVDKDDNAFLTIYTNKEEVFVGEGVNVVLYFYLAETDQPLLDFYDFGNQLTGILKQLKQPHAWEEAFDYTEITPENVIVRGEPYLRYKLYEAVLFPLNREPLRFPQLKLQMIKYRVAKNPSLLTQDRQEGYKIFYSRERVIPVKELPPHPLRDVVPVGDYRLTEKLSKKKVAVNKSFTYLFEVEGEGNLAAIMPPAPQAPAGLEFYPPDVQQDVTKRDGRVVGAKSFAYAVLPRASGRYKMSETLYWIYFNPATAAYDTLRPSLQMQVTGLSTQGAVVLSKDLGSFYNIIENEDNTLVDMHLLDKVRRYTNLIMLVLLSVSAFVFLKK
ncbi:BatD family protein [Pontibacter sp. E15-1]|uniref:BatD family protein n=1 Tax=Pontibacter sp. E15-1 TaxID=2919918 RepID=UPI001F4FF1D6|nr:BatD family protein [Pontibacter sp. E15-1]MCJ8163974.1 BatD family protein [Pontibacter sp. E15-1]